MMMSLLVANLDRMAEIYTYIKYTDILRCKSSVQKSTKTSQMKNQCTQMVQELCESSGDAVRGCSQLTGSWLLAMAALHFSKSSCLWVFAVVVVAVVVVVMVVVTLLEEELVLKVLILGQYNLLLQRTVTSFSPPAPHLKRAASALVINGTHLISSMTSCIYQRHLFSEGQPSEWSNTSRITTQQRAGQSPPHGAQPNHLIPSRPEDPGCSEPLLYPPFLLLLFLGQKHLLPVQQMDIYFSAGKWVNSCDA